MVNVVGDLLAVDGALDDAGFDLDVVIKATKSLAQNVCCGSPVKHQPQPMVQTRLNIYQSRSGC